MSDKQELISFYATEEDLWQLILMAMSHKAHVYIANELGDVRLELISSEKDKVTLLGCFTSIYLLTTQIDPATQVNALRTTLPCLMTIHLPRISGSSISDGTCWWKATTDEDSDFFRSLLLAIKKSWHKGVTFGVTSKKKTVVDSKVFYTDLAREHSQRGVQFISAGNIYVKQFCK